MPTIAIIDDHAMFRQGYCTLLRSKGDFEILFDSESGEMALDILQSGDILPDIILMDLQMPKLTGLETTTIIKQIYPAANVVIMSVMESAQSIVNSFHAGAAAFLSKNTRYEDFLDVTNGVLQGTKYIYRTTYPIEPLIGQFLENISRNSVPVYLSDRQKMFIKFCASNMTYKEIASRMNITPKTADSYREQIFHHLKINSRVSLVLYAIQSGLIALSDLIDSSFTNQL